MKEKNVYILLREIEKLNPATLYGVHLAKALKTRATLLAVKQMAFTEVPSTVAGTGMIYPPIVEFESHREKMEPHLRQLSVQLKSIFKDIDYRIVTGFSEQKTISITENDNPYLLVVESNNDLTTLNEWFGTHETRLAEGAECPVLVVPQKTNWKDIRKMLYIMDPADAKVENMRVLTNLVESLNAHLQVVLLTDQEEADSAISFAQMVEIFRELLGYEDVTFHQIIGQKTNEEIIELLETTEPDWMAFEQKNKNFFERVFDEYNTKRLILQSEIPVLVF
mgnify:CR=1 FL=1